MKSRGFLLPASFVVSADAWGDVEDQQQHRGGHVDGARQDKDEWSTAREAL